MSLKVRVKQCVQRHTINNHPAFPRSIRAVIVGPSGCGKTNLLANLLTNDKWIDYNHLLVFGKSLHQEIYVVLKQAIDAKLPKDVMERLFDNMVEIERGAGMKLKDFIPALQVPRDSETTCEYYENGSDIPDPKEIDATKHNCVIFDDVMLEKKQDPISAYYVRGRHNNIQCFYLAQSYFRIPRQTVRSNSNLFFIFKQQGKDLSHLYQDLACTDMTFDAFKAMCAKAWKADYGFLTIKMDREKEEGRYCYNLDPIPF